MEPMRLLRVGGKTGISARKLSTLSMSMSLRERILSVYRGDTPDVVPFMLDLGHWFCHRNGLAWDLSRAHEEPDHALIEYHRELGVGFYLPSLPAFYSVGYEGDVVCEVRKELVGPRPEITWRYTTPIGSIQRTRVWQEQTYSWAIRDWGVKSVRDLRVLACALGNRTYTACWDRYRAWADCAGSTGVVYLPLVYSGMGELLCYWMGIEGAAYAVADCPEVVREAVDRINENSLKLVDLAAASPAEIILMGDNFSADIQPPSYFRRWSRAYYTEAVRRLHAACKYVAVHIDGKLRNALSMIRETGADCADAVTPSPMGDLTPEQCREEAGPDFILSGGVAPNLWLPNVSDDEFRAAVMAWLALKRRGPRIIANAGDQVPPGAPERRIKMMRDLVEEHGRY